MMHPNQHIPGFKARAEAKAAQAAEAAAPAKRNGAGQRRKAVLDALKDEGKL